jgi:hypothetical protein
MLYTPCVLSPRSSLTGRRKLDIFLEGRPTDLMLCGWANRNWVPLFHFPLFLIKTRISSWQDYSACHLLSRWCLAQLISRPWRWRRYVPPKRRLTLNRLHGVISQKMVLFILTAVRTSNPTSLPKAHSHIRIPFKTAFLAVTSVASLPCMPV